METLVKCFDRKIYMCAFANSLYKNSIHRLMYQAKDMDLFEDGFFFDESDLPSAILEKIEQSQRTGSRGYGYWLWKPYIILESLKELEEHDILLYIDVGCHLNKKGCDVFLSYCNEVKNNESGFLVSHAGSQQLERLWTKGDLLDFFAVRNCSEITDRPQYQAGTIFIRKEPKTIQLIEHWFNICMEHFELLSDCSSFSPNLLGFRGHRNDQSILSILLKIHGTSVIPLEECYGDDWGKLENKFPILQKRDLR